MSKGQHSAFPSSGAPHQHGLSKREWLAGLMMHALVENGDIPHSKREVAGLAIDYADALLAELERE